jgi:hypothetical protein
MLLPWAAGGALSGCRSIRSARSFDKRYEAWRLKGLLRLGETTGGQDEEPQNKAAARDATAVSIVRDGRRFCNSAGRQQLAEWAPVSRMPICGMKE